MSEPLKVTLLEGTKSVRVETAPRVVYKEVRCPECNSLTMMVPDCRFIDVRTHATITSALGRGPVIPCRNRRCGAYVEVIAR